MEWARAKNIIIILLVVMNVFLLSRILMEYGTQGISKETIANAEKILKLRGIVVKSKVPLYDKDTPRLMLGIGEFNKAVQVENLLGIEPAKEDSEAAEKETFENGQSRLTFTGPNSFTYENGNPADTVDISNLNETEKYLKKFLKDRKLDNSFYVLDGTPEVREDGVVYTYLEKDKGFLVYDNYLKATVTKKGVTYLEVSHRQITGFSSEKISDISTAYQILLEHFDGSEKTVITAIDLGYRDVGDEEQNSLQSIEQLPVWRIKIQGAQPRYFGASDGKEIETE